MTGSYLLNLRLRKLERQDLWNQDSKINISGVPASTLRRTLGTGATAPSTGTTAPNTPASRCSLRGLSKTKLLGI